MSGPKYTPPNEDNEFFIAILTVLLFCVVIGILVW